MKKEETKILKGHMEGMDSVASGSLCVGVDHDYRVIGPCRGGGRQAEMEKALEMADSLQEEGWYRLKPCESVIRTGDGKVIHSVCIDDALDILNREKSRSLSAMDKELAAGDVAVDRLEDTIGKSRELSDNVDKMFGKKEPVTPVSKQKPCEESVDKMADTFGKSRKLLKRVDTQVQKQRDQVDEAVTLLKRIYEMKDRGEWVLPGEEGPDGQPRKAKKTDIKDVRETLARINELKERGVCVKPSGLDEEKKGKYKVTLRDGREFFTDDFKNVGGHMDQACNERTGEFISDDTQDPCKPASCYAEGAGKSEEQLWKERKFKEYTFNMLKIFQAKNQDYTAADSIGSAFDVTYDLFGPIAPAVRFMDKVLRYVSLTSGKEQKVADEKVEDTLMDLANYALLTRLKIEKDRKKDEGQD